MCVGVHVYVFVCVCVCVCVCMCECAYMCVYRRVCAVCVYLHALVLMLKLFLDDAYTHMYGYVYMCARADHAKVRLFQRQETV